MTATVALGVDIGGTSAKLALVDAATGSTLGRRIVASSAADGPETTLRRLHREAGTLDADGKATAFGVAVPGNVDRSRLVISYVPALGADWAGIALRSVLPEATALVNDVQAMTLAEWRLGAAHGAADVLCIAIGTGVGGGLVVGNRLHLGIDETAGAIGHTTVEPSGEECYCGNRGCLERYACGPAIAKAAGTVDAEAAAAAAARGDARALDAFDRAGRYLGIAIANVCALLTPTVVVLGGGVAAAGSLLVEPATAELDRRATVVAMHSTTVVAPALGEFAGAVGAALAAHETLMRTKSSARPRDKEDTIHEPAIR